MNLQADKVRKYVLDQLESGEFVAGSKTPGSRELAETLDVSRPTVQNSLDTLVNEGILKSFQRRGLYVDDAWRSRRIGKTLHVYTYLNVLPWMRCFQSEMERILPQLHITTKFEEGAFEFLTTAIAQSHWDEFVDLTPILEECYPDRKDFFVEQLKTFQVDGRLFAIPFLFSPRVIAYNKDMFREAGCDMPSPEWEWDEFISVIRKLRKHFNPSRIFSLNVNYYLWMNFVLSAGGTLFDPAAEDPVRIDSEATLLGLHRFREVRDEIFGQQGGEFFMPENDHGRTALSLIDRQIFGRDGEEMFRDFGFAPIPKIGNRLCHSIQATELFAVRRGNMDHELTAEIIRFLWSEKFQDKLAGLKYGIPIRKSSAEKTFSAKSEANEIFRKECDYLQVDYNLRAKPLFELVTRGISKILSGHNDIDREVASLALTVRNYIRFIR